MKYIAFLFIALFLVGILFANRENVQRNTTPSNPEVTHTTTPSPKQLGIRTAFFTVDNPRDMKLYSNLSDQFSAKEAKEKYECQNLISGGFYSDSTVEGQNGNHIGLFVTDGQVFSQYRENALFNGFLSITEDTSSISPNVPSNTDIALQTGPLLITKGTVRKLSLTRDEKARRMVAGVTSDNTLLFMTFFEASSYVSGPKLVELPELVKKLAEDENVEIVDAINLDGGAHSAFLTDELTLTDIQTPGSYFCITE